VEKEFDLNGFDKEPFVEIAKKKKRKKKNKLCSE